MSESPSSTIAELESRLKDLEIRFLGTPSEVSNPFAPISASKTRIERFKSLSSENVERRDQKEMKLPAVTLPSFDGSDLETFLKDFERWMRL